MTNRDSKSMFSGRMYMNALMARHNARAAEGLQRYIDAQEADVRLRTICQTREQYDVASALLPAFDRSRARELALNRVSRHMAAGEPPERAREAARHTWVEECAWMSEAAHRTAMSAERCSEAFRRFGEAYGHMTTPKRGRGRNRRFHGPKSS